MKLDDFLIQRIVAYFDGKLTPDQIKNLEHDLKIKGISFNELKDLENLSEKLEQLPQPQPSERMSIQFHRRLMSSSSGRFKHFWQTVNQKFKMPQIVYALVMIIFGFILGNWVRDDSPNQKELVSLSAEVREMKRMVSLTLLQHPSPLERLKAVNDISVISINGQSITNALLNVLYTDPNTNVRLAALDVLQNHIGESQVRQGIIHALMLQKSPVLQLAVADIIVGFGDREAIESLQAMLKQKDLNIVVRNKLQQTINKLI